MAIFGLKKRKDEKLEQSAQVAKGVKEKGVKQKKAESIAKSVAVMPKQSKTKEVAVPTLRAGADSNAASVIIRPRVTEKSGLLSQGGVYTFEVARSANKHAVSKAVTALYKVTPVKVAMINTPVKNVFVKGRRGTVAGIRKAIVTVRKGEKIDFV
jgi:large subunit ribosomal protein L23